MKLIALILFVAASYVVNAQCSAPGGLSTYPITATAATAHWEAATGATTYDVEIKPASSISWTPYLTGTTSLACFFSLLDPTTLYDWRVKANCPSGTSTFTETQFTTGPIGSCTSPGGLFASNIATITATLNWGSVIGAYSYSVQYKPVSSGTWINATTGTAGTSVNLYSLTGSTTYDWRVSSNCSLTESSVYSSSQFTTSGSTPPPPPSACPGPYDVSTNGTIGGAAAISLNTDVKGTIAPKNDIDYYKFTISSDGIFTVWLTTLPANYNLAVLNSSGTQLGISQNKSTKSESVTLSAAAGTYYAKVFPVNTANSATSCYTLKVQTVTATRAAVTAPTMENVNPDFTINLFPNPADGQLNVLVDGVDRNVGIKVYNLMGKLVMQRQSSNVLTQLDISKLSSGIYLLKVNNGRETKAAKFIKQ